MTAYLLRQAAVLELLKRDPPVAKYRSMLPGLWHYHGGREGTKRYLQLAWLARRMEAHRDSSEIIRHAEANTYVTRCEAKEYAEASGLLSVQPMSTDDQLALVLDGLERDWKKMWSEK